MNRQCNSQLILIFLVNLSLILTDMCFGADEFQINIGSDSYTLSEGIPSKVTTPQGEYIEVTAKKREFFTYNDNEIKFNCHSDMRVYKQSSPGVDIITAECNLSPWISIQIFSIPNDPMEVQSTLYTSFKRELEMRGAEFKKNDETIVYVEGEKRKGKKAEYFIRDKKYEMTVVSYRKNAKSIAISFQNDIKDIDLAKKYFSAILNSLRLFP